MSEATEPTNPAESKKKKKRDKVRSAWISFVGRIIAQVVGAVATIVLGVMFVQKYASQDTARGERSAGGESREAPARVRRADGRLALAVLPLQNLSGDRTQEYFVDGMTEALIADLAQIDKLHVISRTSSMHYKDQRKPLVQIAQELGVDLVLEGSVARDRDRVRVTAQLIDARSDEHLWARSYDRTIRDVLSLQADVATEVAKEINLTLTSASQGHLTDRRPVNPAAYEVYLKGREAWNTRTPSGFEQAIKYFDEAIRMDPEFALAYAGLADTYSLSGLFGVAAGRSRGAEAKSAAQRALQLDEHLGEAHTSLAAVHHRQEGNISAADQEFTRALELNPGYATAHQWYALLLAEEGRDDQAIRHAQQAVALDPLSGTMHQTLGFVHYYGRRYDETVSAMRRAIELAPQLPLARAILARALLLQGKHTESIEVYQQAGAKGDSDLVSTASVAFLRAGDRARSDALVQSLLSRRPLPAIPLSKWYALTDNKDAAYRMLERVVADGMPLQQLKSDPVFDGMRKEARFAALVQRGASNIR